MESLAVIDGKIYFNTLSSNLLHIREVYSVNGEPVPYTQTAKYLSVDSKEVCIEYEYAPKSVGLEEETGYEEKDVPSRVLAYGVAAEFSISQRMFDEAVTFHKRYVDALSEILTPKNVTVKKRSFV